MMLLQLVLPMVLQRLWLRPDPARPPVWAAYVDLRPKGGLWMHAAPA